MFDKSQQIFTFTLTNGTLNITEGDGVTAVAIKLLSGTGTYKGTKSVGGQSSTATSIAVGDSVTVSSEQTKFIQNLVIDCSAGVAEIIAR